VLGGCLGIGWLSVFGWFGPNFEFSMLGGVCVNIQTSALTCKMLGQTHPWKIDVDSSEPPGVTPGIKM
jgi:hypothetical protein